MKILGILKIMKNWLILFFILTASFAQGKLSDRQSMKCIDADKLTKSAFQDLQAAYEMRLVTAKDFLQVMDKAPNCPQLKKDLKKLHASAISTFPQTKSPTRNVPGVESDSGFGENEEASDFSAPPPLPPPGPESDFEDDFSDFR